MTTVRDMVNRGIIPEPKTNEDWVAARAAKRAKNVANAREVLKENSIRFCESIENGQVKFDVLFSSVEFLPFFPEEGKWYQTDFVVRYGLRKLVKLILDQRK